VKIGVISDTHGLLRPEAVAALAGVDLILHAGDVGDPAILDTLGSIAPVTAIRGNVDTHGRCAELPETEYVTVANTNVYMLHDVAALDLDPAAAQVAAVIYGHSHKPSIEWRRGVLFFNPGSAGPRRFVLPVSLGMLEVTATGIEPRLVTLL
jgi:putative phosphoesterase